MLLKEYDTKKTDATQNICMAVLIYKKINEFKISGRQEVDYSNFNCDHSCCTPESLDIIGLPNTQLSNDTPLEDKVFPLEDICIEIGCTLTHNVANSS